MTNTKDFDDALRTLNANRSSIYSHPIDDFRRNAAGADVIEECKDPEVRHALRLIWMKVCRLIQTPDHQDSLHDIAGYARAVCLLQDARDRTAETEAEYLNSIRKMLVRRGVVAPYEFLRETI